MNYEQGFEHAIPPEKKGYLYIYKYNIDICPLLEPIKLQNCKIPPARELRKKEKLMVSY